MLMMVGGRKSGLGHRRPTVRVSHADKRSPMTRLLQDGRLPENARGVMVAVSYDQQWRTLWKAQELGYLDADQYLTEKGRAYLAKARGETA